MSDFKPSLQKSVMALLIFGDQTALVARGGLPMSVWNADPAIHTLMGAVYDFIDLYSCTPKQDIYALIDLMNLKPDKHEKVTNLVRTCEILYDESTFNFDFVISEVNKFHRHSLWEDTIQKCAQLITQGRVDDVEDLVNRTSKKQIETFDPGVGLVDGVDLLLNDIGGIPLEDRVSTGIQGYDDREIFFRRGEMFGLLGGAKAGKSMFLVHAGKQALIEGKRVVYITLELSSKIVLQRFYQSLFFYSLFHEQDGRMQPRIDRNLIEMAKREHPKALRDPSTLYSLKTDVQNLGYIGQNLRIKQYPGNTLTIAGLRAYLDGLRLHENFDADMVLVDYPRLMKMNAMNLRGSHGDVLVDLRSIAQEENKILVVVLQTTKEGMKSSEVEGVEIAEDVSAIRTLDTLISISKTELEHQLGFARLKACAVRNGEMGFRTLITQDFSTSNWLLSSAEMSAGLDQHYQQFIGVNEDE